MGPGAKPEIIFADWYYNAQIVVIKEREQEEWLETNYKVGEVDKNQDVKREDTRSVRPTVDELEIYNHLT